MELPIAKQSYGPSTEALVRAIKRADVIQARTAADETELTGAVAFTNPRRPDIRMVNFATDLNIPEGAAADGVLAEVLDRFRSVGVRCWTLRSAEHIWPAPLAEAAERAGYARKASALMVLEKFKRPRDLNAEVQVIPGRAAYSELRNLHRRDAIHTWATDDRVADDLADSHLDFLDDSRFECFLGRIAGRPVGAVYVLTLGNIGVITDVFTDHEHRRRGVGRTLMTHAIEFCHRALFERVVLETDPGNAAAVALYDSLGFTRATTFDFFRLPIPNG